MTTACVWAFPAAAADTGDAARGQQAFVQSCGFCHGADATGGRAPDLVRSPLVVHDENGNLIAPVIKNGRPEKGMPPLPLSDATIADITAFLHARVRASMHSRGVNPDRPDRLLSGNAAHGRELFTGKYQCAKCHSGNDLASAVARYKPLQLELAMLYPRRAERTATVHTKSGETATGTLLHIDEFYVALRDETGRYRSFDRRIADVKIADPLAAHRDMLDRYTDRDIHDLFAYLMTLKPETNAAASHAASTEGK